MGHLHASAFAYGGMGCVVLGESGSGKSRLVTDAMLHGAQLIADDRVQFEVRDGQLLAGAVPQLAGVLELRGLGLIRVDALAGLHAIHLVITLRPTHHAHAEKEIGAAGSIPSRLGRGAVDENGESPHGPLTQPSPAGGEGFTARLPEPSTHDIMGIPIPHLRIAPPPISALLLYLDAMREGRILPPDWHPVG